jgi:hypothetical protein
MADADVTSIAPIFVVGTPRSGTTLTSRILRRQSRLFAGGAADFFEDIYARRGDIGDPGTDAGAREQVIERLRTLYRRRSGGQSQERIDRLFAQTDLLDELRQASGYAELFSTFMESQARAAGKPRWVNHVPKDVFHLNDIFAWFPDARVVICARHVLDFLVSYRDQFRRAQRRATSDNADRLRKLYHPAGTSMLWRASVGVAIDALARWPGRTTLSLYEDLVSDPARQVARLCAFLGEAFEPDMLQVDLHNSSRAVSTEGIFATSVGQWRAQLSDTEAWLAQTLCGDGLRRLGYAIEPVRPRWTEVGRWAGTLPAYALTAMRANADRRGPNVRYLAKRLDALVRAK